MARVIHNEVQRVMLKNALYNLHPASGASADYGQGVLVGVVSALTGTFDENIEAIAPLLPDGWNHACTPEAWVPELKATTAWARGRVYDWSIYG